VWRLLDLIACLVLAPTVAAAQLSLSAQSAGPGSSLLIQVNLAQGTDLVSGLQFDLQYDSSVMSLMVTAGDAARKSAKILYYKDLTQKVRRFLMFGLNQTPIPGGTLLNLFVNLTPILLRTACVR
jgi:Cohesin domain